MKGTQGPSRRQVLETTRDPQADVLGKRQSLPKKKPGFPEAQPAWTEVASLPDRLPEATAILWVGVGVAADDIIPSC